MGQKIRDLMTDRLVDLDPDRPIAEGARRMREENIGDVLLTRGGKLEGIVTDRDIVVRCIAEDGDPRTGKLGDICSRDMITLSPDDDAAEAARLMGDKAIRRLPVVENGLLRGVVSLGDLAVERDQHSALREISAAPPTR